MVMKISYRKAEKYFIDKDFRFYANARIGLHNSIPDEEYIKRMFRAKMGYELNLEDPKTFNEKLQWLKLHNRRPVYTTMVDKCEAKKYIAERVGEKYIIPTLGVWDHFEEIDFALLPKRFVLKTTHDSGGVAVCTDKETLDTAALRKIMNEHLNNNFYLLFREWPYKDVKPRIMAEEYLEADDGDLKDYKLFAFNGTVRALYVTSDRANGLGLKADYFDAEFNRIDLKIELPNSDHEISRPAGFEEMKRIAGELSVGIPEVRVDFYEVKGQVLVGELTLFDGGGFAPFDPVEWDYQFGSWIDLSLCD